MTLDALLANQPSFESGSVWLVGGGPGDPALLTVAALSALAQADLIVFDALVDERILALAPPRAERIFAGKRGGKPSVDQRDITALLIEQARAGHRVLRLKGGDPFVFGRGGEECAALARAGIPYRIVPGVTAGLAGLISARIPTTMRGVNQGLFLATGHGAGDSGAADSIDWRLVARLGQPIVLYMAMRKLPIIREQLIAGGMAGKAPAAVIVSATSPKQKVLVTTLERIVEDAALARLEPPAIVAIGDIVAERNRLAHAVEAVLAEAVE